jgi:hypothetical protein
MKQELLAPAEATTIPEKENRLNVMLNKSTVDALPLASGEDAGLDPQPPIEPSLQASSADAPTEQGLLHVVLRAPDGLCNWEAMRTKDYRNLVYCELRDVDDVREVLGHSRLKRRACFVVRVEPWEQYVDEGQDEPFLVPCCEVLTVFVRGTVPMPAYLPSQIIDGGFKGVFKTIEAMWPTARRCLVSDSIEAPSGWSELRFYPKWR